MRLIDVDKLGVGRCSEEVLPHDHCFAWNTLIGIIENAPTVDAVPVVRCRDCKYFIKDSDLDHIVYPNEICADGYCSNMWCYTDAMEFCSYGKRREENGYSDMR